VERFDIQITDGEKTWWECGFRSNQIALLKSMVGANEKNYAPLRGQKYTPEQYAAALIERTNYDESLWCGDKARVLTLVSVGKKPEDPTTLDL